MSPRSEALHRAADLMLQLELDMRRARLWHSQPPAPAAMASRTPFCADTLQFTQWLQFVFLTRMHELIEHDQALPANSDIAVMAREALSDVDGKQAIVDTLQAFDDLVARQPNR